MIGSFTSEETDRINWSNRENRINFYWWGQNRLKVENEVKNRGL